MTLNTVTLTWDLTDFLQAGMRATLSLTPNAVLTDAANHLVIPEVQRSAQFANGTGSLAGIIACDNGTILPSGWAYTLTVSVLGQGELLKETVQINFANGATQDLSALIPLSPAPGLVGYLPLPSGTPQAGYVPVASGAGEASAWGPGGGGITPPAGDIGGSTGTPTVVSTHLSSALPVNQGGTGQGTQQAAIDALAGAVTSGLYLRGNGTHVTLAAIQAGDVPALAYDASGAAATAQANAQSYADTNKLAKSSNLSDVASAPTARTNLGLTAAAVAALPLSVANGGTGQATDPLPPFMASDAGYLAWTFDPGASIASVAGQTLGNATVTLIRVNLRIAGSVTNVVVYLGTLGSGLVSGQNFAGLYNSAGTLVGTSADQTTTWNTGGSTGLKTIPLSGGPFACSAGYFWVALLCNQSAGTTAAFGRAQNLGSTLQNAGLAAAGLRWCTNGTGTTLPASITPASNSASSSAYWAALS